MNALMAAPAEVKSVTTVRDVMTRDVLWVEPEAPLKHVAALLVGHRISGVPVVDDGHVVGVISQADLLAKEAAATDDHPTHRLRLPPRDRQTAAKRDATTVGQAMTAPAVTVAPACSIAEAARLMVHRHINRLPVVEAGRLVGIVTRSDLVRIFARPDEELAETIRQDVLLDSLWLDPTGFKVTVEDGLVRIEGSVDRRSTAGILTDLIARTPGVVGVTALVHWTTDDRDARPEPADYVSRFTAR